MSIGDKISNFLRSDDEYYEYEDEQTEDFAEENSKRETKVMSLVNKNNGEKKIMLFEPRVFSDVKAIATRLLNGQATLVNFQRMDDQQAHRVVDFLSGVVMAVEGNIQRVGEQIFLCTPSDFVVEGDLTNDSRLEI